VLLSSHLMSEMAQTADHLIVLGRGRVLADAPVAAVVAGATSGLVRVRSPHADRLGQAVARPEVVVTSVERDVIEITGLTAAQVGDAAMSAGVVLHELTPVTASLEDAYLSLTQGDVEYHSAAVGQTEQEIAR
jgi:ABC-2 type transport system ATP-binding protein